MEARIVLSTHFEQNVVHFISLNFVGWVIACILKISSDVLSTKVAARWYLKGHFAFYRSDTWWRSR